VARTTPRHGNLTTHLAAAVVVPGCIALCWWQVTRALSGNTLSWAYVFEWPIFGAYGVYMWWKLIHDHPAENRSDDEKTDPATASGGYGTDPGPGGEAGAGVTADADDEDEEMASYNRYLAALNASGKRKHW
jgi:hypothetical protein